MKVRVPLAGDRNSFLLGFSFSLPSGGPSLCAGEAINLFLPALPVSCKHGPQKRGGFSYVAVVGLRPSFRLYSDTRTNRSRCKAHEANVLCRLTHVSPRPKHSHRWHNALRVRSWLKSLQRLQPLPQNWLRCLEEVVVFPSTKLADLTISHEFDTTNFKFQQLCNVTM